jgi:hypothetical protein
MRIYRYCEADIDIVRYRTSILQYCETETDIMRSSVLRSFDLRISDLSASVMSLSCHGYAMGMPLAYLLDPFAYLLDLSPYPRASWSTSTSVTSSRSRSLHMDLRDGRPIVTVTSPLVFHFGNLPLKRSSPTPTRAGHFLAP